MARDTQYEEHTIVGVSSETDGWSVQVKNEAYLFVPDNGVDSIAPSAGETMRTYGRGHGYPVRGIVIGGRVYTYQTAGQMEGQSEDPPSDPATPVTPPDYRVELANLRRATRALAGVATELTKLTSIINTTTINPSPTT